jgi:anti-anti-sigma factor
VSFIIGQENVAGVPVLRLVGEIDINAVPTLREAMDRAYGGGASSLALDFNGVTFVDSSGLGALLSAKRRAVESGGQVYLLGTSPPLERLLEMLSLKPLFVFVPDAVDLDVIIAEQQGS